MSGRAVGSEYLVPEELVEVHPLDVAAWGLTDGGLATLASRRGEVLVKVKATDQSPRGTVFCSFSFSEVPIHSLTGSGYEPITDTAELKICAARIEPASGVLAQLRIRSATTARTERSWRGCPRSLVS